MNYPRKVRRAAFDYTDPKAGPNHCQDCSHFNAGKSQCYLFDKTNKACPEFYALDVKVAGATGWCRAFDKK